MANRFEKKKLHIGHMLRKIYILAAIVIIIIFLNFLSSFQKDTLVRQLTSLENALQRDIVQCYAVEGMYPPSLSYLKEHYGLSYDENTFFVDYQPIGSNIYPDCTILLISQ